MQDEVMHNGVKEYDRLTGAIECCSSFLILCITTVFYQETFLGWFVSIVVSENR